MADIRDISKITEKWKVVTPARSEQYREGVTAPLRDWEKNTKAAESNYEEGVKAAILRKGFGKGVTKAGTKTWQDKAIAVGVDRFGPGVVAGAGNYEKGFAPYRDVIAKTTLPARGPKGSEANYQRVMTIGKALHAKKIS